MVCQYVTKKGKTCNIKKVDEETQMCSKHINNYLNKKNKEEKKENIFEPKKNNENIIKIEDRSMKKKKKEKKIEYIDYENDENEENELDKIINENEVIDEYQDDNLSNIDDITKETEKKSKDFQLAILKMAYNTCTSILESMSAPYLDNFSNQCANDPNINKCIEDLNNENNIEIFMNASPEIRLLFFTGVIATQKIANAITIGNTVTTKIQTFEKPEYKDTNNDNDDFSDL